MDILQRFLPDGYSAPDIEIPKVETYAAPAGTEFNDFPTACGFPVRWVEGYLELLVDRNRSYEEYTDFLQSWLYEQFILHVGARMGWTIDMSKFLVHSERNEGVMISAARGLASIDTSGNAFTPFFRSKQNIAHRLISKLRRAYYYNNRYERYINKEFGPLLDVVVHNCTLFDYYDASSRFNTGERARVLLAIRYMAANIFRFGGPQREDPYIWPQRLRGYRLAVDDGSGQVSPVVGLMKDYLMRNGWCPVRVHALLSRENLNEVYFAAAIVEHNLSPKDHINCWKNGSCVVSNIDPQNFSQRHVEDGCPCSLIHSDMPSVYSILERGEIPIAEVTRDKVSRSLSVRIVPASPLTKYMAISHVWADGLADPTKNSIFSCHIHRLIEDALSTRFRFDHSRFSPLYWARTSWSHLREDVFTKRQQFYFWIDALCVPALDDTRLQRSQELKQKAIDLMTPTYAGASSVMVLDRGIQGIKPIKNLRTDSVAPFEPVDTWSKLHFLLLYSSWMGRCWTFQEGGLARRLYFRCSGWICAQPRGLQLTSTAMQFETLLENLLSRSTSMPADLHQLIANLGSFHCRDVARLTSSYERSRGFLRSQQGGIPVNLLLRYQSVVPQQPREEWWVPDLESKNSFYANGKTWAHLEVCDQGVILPTFDWQTFQHDPSKPFLIETDNSFALPKHFRSECDGRRLWIQLDLDPISFMEEYTTAKIILLLPQDRTALNAEGFIGRGLCLTILSDEQIELPGSDGEPSRKAWPTLFNCALSFGVKTPVSIDRNLLPIQSIDWPLDRDGRRFLMRSDIASWPSLEP